MLGRWLKVCGVYPIQLQCPHDSFGNPINIALILGYIPSFFRNEGR